MKSQRRHDLQQNTLSMKLGKGLSFLRVHSTIILWCLLGVAIVVLGATWVVKNARANEHLVQSQYARLAQTPPGGLERVEDLKAIVDQNHQPYSALAAAEIGNDFTSRLIANWNTLLAEERQEYRNSANQWFEKVLMEYPTQDQAVAKARLGLARIAESWGEYDRAEELYQQVMQMDTLAGHSVMLLARQGLSTLPELKKAQVSIWPDPVIEQAGEPVQIELNEPSPSPDEPQTQPQQIE